MFHNKCKERGVVEESLISPESSFVMPLHLLKKPENGNFEEALREHEVSKIAKPSLTPCPSLETSRLSSSECQNRPAATLFDQQLCLIFPTRQRCGQWSVHSHTSVYSFRRLGI
jgi:hypothetical protein